MNSRKRGTVVAGFAVAGVAFAGYPALRPWAAETGQAGAQAFGSVAWVASHGLAMVGFVMLAMAVQGARAVPQLPAGLRRASLATQTWVAASLLLPYYGAESFALNAVGRYATARGDTDVLEIADSFRYAPVAVATFTLGLVLLAVLGARILVALRHAAPVLRLGGVMTALGLATFLPQFFLGPELRVAHGVVLAAGLLLLALGALSAEDAGTPDEGALLPGRP